MGSLAVFGLTNDGANLVVSLLILFLLVFWLALIYWTYADARRRIEDPMLVGCATAAAFFPFAGTIVYMIVRPPEFIDDRRERELEIAAAEARLASIEHLSCPYCAFDVERSFLRCPSCLRRLKEPCGTCGKPLDPRWKICPYCESEIGHAAPQPRPAEPRRERPAVAAPVEQPQRQRKPSRASAAERKPARASGNGEPVREAPATAGSSAAPARPDGGAARAPAQGGKPRPAGEARQRSREADRPQRPADASRAKRPSDGRNAKRPSDDRSAKRPTDGRNAQRPDGDRTQRPGDRSRSPRPGEPAQRERPPSGTRRKQADRTAREQPASDEVTAEQAVPRPRTRPPSAG